MSMKTVDKTWYNWPQNKQDNCRYLIVSTSFNSPGSYKYKQLRLVGTPDKKNNYKVPWCMYVCTDEVYYIK